MSAFLWQRLSNSKTVIISHPPPWWSDELWQSTRRNLLPMTGCEICWFCVKCSNYALKEVFLNIFLFFFLRSCCGILSWLYRQISRVPVNQHYYCYYYYYTVIIVVVVVIKTVGLRDHPLGLECDWPVTPQFPWLCYRAEFSHSGQTALRHWDPGQ